VFTGGQRKEATLNSAVDVTVDVRAFSRHPQRNRKIHSLNRRIRLLKNKIAQFIKNVFDRVLDSRNPARPIV
jgi:hypothetical protein